LKEEFVIDPVTVCIDSLGKQVPSTLLIPDMDAPDVVH
jgi:hypothetical protein